MDYLRKSVLITGAGSGIGRELALQLGSAGATVWVTDINAASAQETANLITSTGGKASAHQMDVSDGEQVRAQLADVVTEFGRIDYMFNNAGFGMSGEVSDMTLDHWKRIIDVNLWGVIHGTDAAYKLMITQKSGHIINMASLAGLIPFPTSVGYSTTKHAVLGLTNSLRPEAAYYGINVSAVCPGFVKTPIYTSAEQINIDTAGIKRQIPFRQIDVTRAVKTILKGVAANNAVITFPGHAKLMWRLQQLSPRLTAIVMRRTVRKFHENKLS